MCALSLPVEHTGDRPVTSPHTDTVVLFLLQKSSRLNSRDSAGRRSLRRSRSFKVTDFGTNRKPVRDFLLVNNTNLHPVSRCFQVIADYWSNLRFRQGVYLSLTRVRGELLNSGPGNLAPRNCRSIVRTRGAKCVSIF